MRTCGTCQLCCKLVPVVELGKDAGERCKHQRVGKGCTVYGSRAMPASCRIWNCRWLVNDPDGILSRPDRAHYVIDVFPDFVTIVNNETGAKEDYPTVQVWVDPNFPDAHRDPALRRYLEKEQMIALVRYNDTDGLALIPPQISSHGRWLEQPAISSGKNHSPIDIENAIGKLTAVIEP